MGAETWRGPALTDGIRGGRWLNLAAVATWLFCGLPPLLDAIDGAGSLGPTLAFFVAFLVYGAALLTILYLPESDRPGAFRRLLPVVLLLVESITGLTLIFLSGHYFGGTAATSATLVIVAAQAPYILRAKLVWVLVGLQTVGLPLLFFTEAPTSSIVSIALAIGGFQAFAAGSSFLAMKEAAGRSALAATNAELRAAQARLDESSRTEERLRISRDLHDTLGHHLTALSLQLEVASRLTEGKAAGHVQQAHAITRLLLNDVRDVVSTLREARTLDLVTEIRALAASSSSVAVHVEMPATLDVPDQERAQALLRWVQEIITNAARHAGARNLWIRLAAAEGGIEVHARDDGRGAASLALGHGLTGMRERFTSLAGSVEFESRPDAGFEVRGFLPVPRSAS
jgi:signal transduction histidine kinase